MATPRNSTASDPKLPIGSGRCRCAKCGEYFSTVGTFDKHQRQDADGRPVCREPASAGLVLADSGYWQYPAPDRPFPSLASARHATKEGTEVSGVIDGNSIVQRALGGM